MGLVKKDVIKLVLPIFTEQTFIMSMGMVNTMMAGRIGKEAVSAIGMVDSINNIFISFFSALAVGGTVVVAQYLGRGDVKQANNATKQALYSGVFISLIVTIVTWLLRQPLINILYGSAEQKVISNAYIYLGITLLTYPLIAVDLVCNGILRGAGDTRTPMKITIFMNFLNVIFSYFFIYGIEIRSVNFNINIQSMGVKGAALGIALARTIGAFIVLLVLLRGSTIIRLKNIKSFKVNIQLLKPIFGIGIPASLESLLFNIGKLITQIYIVDMGTVSIAANSVTGSIAGMLQTPGTAFSIAATALVGKYMGKGKTEEAEKYLHYVTYAASVCLLFMAGLSIGLSNFLPSLYTKDTNIIILTSKLLKINALFMVIWPFSFVLPAGLKGAGDAKYTLITTITGMWVFRITLGYLLAITLKLGVIGVWLGMYADWLVRGTLYFIRLKKGKWKNHIVIGK